MIATAAAIAAPPLADVVVRWAHERIDGRPPNGADQTLFGERDAPIARLSRIFGLTGDEMRLVAMRGCPRAGPTSSGGADGRD